jgi:hypothetical protein
MRALKPGPVSKRVLPSGEWMHLAVVVGGERAKMYIDGVQVIWDQEVFTKTRRVERDKCYFGGAWPGFDYTNADLDEIKFLTVRCLSMRSSLITRMSSRFLLSFLLNLITLNSLFVLKSRSKRNFIVKYRNSLIINALHQKLNF